nr:MAG TPA: hypothetical protein [Caudoviricetes sp.]
MKYICYTDNFSRMIVGHRGRVRNRETSRILRALGSRLPGGGIY